MKVRRFLKKKRNQLKKEACKKLSKRLFNRKKVSFRKVIITNDDVESNLFKD